MDELISREVAKQFVRSERGAILLKHFPLNAIIILKLIDEIPAIDAAPVVHGYWVRVPDYPGEENKPTWDCSECGAMVGKRYNYCPHCGAKMDKE